MSKARAGYAGIELTLAEVALLNGSETD